MYCIDLMPHGSRAKCLREMNRTSIKQQVIGWVMGWNWRGYIDRGWQANWH